MVRNLARKKKQESSGGDASWLNTFADLMNLLLCFFVLLFSMSSVDAEKFEQISKAFSSSFSIFSGGGSAIEHGQLISSGVSQLNDLDEYFNNMGKNDEDIDVDEGEEGYIEEIDELQSALDKLQEEMIKQTEEMYDNISELAGKYNIMKDIELGIDPDYKYVQISIRGEILFDSGKAKIKTQVKPILSKVGDILIDYKGFYIEIEGHTDNVPMTNGTYQNNNWLSSARALNAAEYFIKEKGLNPSKLKYSGRGEYDPIDTNSNSKGRAKNRRIEIKIYNQLSSK